MIRDFRREIYEPLLKTQKEIGKIANQQGGIVAQYSDPEAQNILINRGRNMNQQQQMIYNANPNIQRDVQRLSSLDQLNNRLIQQKQMLENDYLQLYGTALSESTKPAQRIEDQTQSMLRGSALAQIRDQGFAMGQATKRGDSQAMKSKIQSDINTQGAIQRAQIQAQQDEKMMQADNMRAQMLLGIAQQLQQQQQQNFQNNLTIKQFNMQKTSTGSRGMSPAGINALLKMQKYQDEKAKQEKAQEFLNNITKGTVSADGPVISVIKNAIKALSAKNEQEE